jgi:hypothetical protein
VTGITNVPDRPQGRPGRTLGIAVTKGSRIHSRISLLEFVQYLACSLMPVQFRFRNADFGMRNEMQRGYPK